MPPFFSTPPGIRPSNNPGTRGQVLTSTGSAAPLWSAPPFTFTTGHYYGLPYSTGVNTATPGEDNLRCAPIYLVVGTLSSIGIEVTSAASANGVARLGIYGMGTNGAPDTLILDAGTVATTSTGWKEITISQAISTAGWYFLACVSQGGSVTDATYRSQVVPTLIPQKGDTSGYLRSAFDKYGVSGALPSPFAWGGDLDSGDIATIRIGYSAIT